MQSVIFACIVLIAITLNILTTQGFFNVSDRLLIKQTTNLLSNKEPAKIEIEKIKIKSLIERIGIASDGKMQAPSSPKIVSWYQFSALPGEYGNMVLSGHKDSAFGPGVFYTLENIKPKTQIKITDTKQNTFTYTVTQIQTVETENLPIKEIFAEQKKAKRLYIITCAGNFDFFAKRYNKRLLVQAEI